MRKAILSIVIAAVAAAAAAVATVALAAAPPLVNMVPQKIVFARVFPNAGQVGLFIAAADGSDEHPLVGLREIDYDPVWAPDGASIVFTSDREGSADLFRVKPDGTGLERLTTNPAYDDQAAFSPDGRQLVFVTTRNGGKANLWTMDLQTRRGKALTTGAGGDFRPAWSPDGQWIAFSSDRGSTLPFGHGRWEHLQIEDIYVLHPDGTGLKRISEHGNFCGSPKFSADSRRVITYCMNAELTLETRRFSPQPTDATGPNLDTRLVSIDIATGTATEVAAGRGVKFNPSVLPENDIGYIRKNAPDAGIYYTSGKRGPKGDVRAAAWSPDGKRVAFHKRLTAPPTTWLKTFSRNPQYELTLSGLLPSFNSTGDRFVMTGRGQGVLGATVAVATTGSNKFDVLYQDKNRNVMAPSWSPGGDKILFGIGVYNLFFNGFNGTVLKPEDRIEGGAQIAIINPDGSGFREVTSGANNNGFPSMAPDGKRFVYRSFGPDGEGLRIMNLETKAIATLTKGYDNFPLWSPRGDLIMFSRAARGDYEIYTIKPDGTGVKRLTFSKGNDAHMAWSPDGESIVFASTRMGFKDEGTYTDAPQPYGELFVMRYDGTNLQQLTDNQWEDGTPAWQPTGRAAPSTSLGARAEEITLVAPGGIRAAIVKLIPDFEQKTGYKVKATFGSGGGTKQQVVRGEPFDVPIVQPPYPDVLSSGHVVVSSETPLATVAVGVAVRKGDPKPDISTPDAVKRMLLAAKFISYPNGANGAAAGVSFDETLKKLGIAEQMKPKIKLAQGGAGAMALLAKGEIDIGLTFISEIITEPGVEVVGPLPREISTPTALVGFLSAHAKAPDAARALLRYLSSPDAAAIYKASGMQPGR